MSTGRQLKRLRLMSRLSAEKAAALIGIDPDRLRKWEAKGMEPRAEDARKIEAFFGKPLEQLEKVESFNFFQNIPLDPNEPVAEEPAQEYNTIRTLAETNRALSEANRTLADAHKLIAESHNRLTKGNEDLIYLLKVFSSDKQVQDVPVQDVPAGGTLAAVEELRRTGRTGSFEIPKKGAQQGNSSKGGR